MNLRDIIKKHLLLEQQRGVDIADLSARLRDNLTFNNILAKSDRHFDEQLKRHTPQHKDYYRNLREYGRTNCDDRVISTGAIMDLVDDARERIAENILDGRITMGTKFVVTRVGGEWNDLSVVLSAQNLFGEGWRFTAITVGCYVPMRKSPGQLQLYIGEDEY